MGFKRRTNPKPLPELGYTPPMQAANVQSLPNGPDWSYEVMHDGFRAQAVHNPSGMYLISHNGRDLSGRFNHFLPELATAVPSGAKLDGVLVALDERGFPSYQLLQNASANRAPLIYFSFDLLALAGRDVTACTLHERRGMLRTFVRESDRVQMSEPVYGEAISVMQVAQRNRLDGIIAKSDDSQYESGQRSGAWAKLSLVRKQPFVIGGFTRGTHGFDELAIGFYQAGQFRLCAMVRSGFIPDTRQVVFAHLSRLITKNCPFTGLSDFVSLGHEDDISQTKLRSCIWVRPELVAQFGFLEWSASDQIRGVKFLGLRDDKNPRTVTRWP